MTSLVSTSCNYSSFFCHRNTLLHYLLYGLIAARSCKAALLCVKPGRSHVWCCHAALRGFLLSHVHRSPNQQKQDEMEIQSGMSEGGLRASAWIQCGISQRLCALTSFCSFMYLQLGYIPILSSKPDSFGQKKGTLAARKERAPALCSSFSHTKICVVTQNINAGSHKVGIIQERSKIYTTRLFLILLI